MENDNEAHRNASKTSKKVPNLSGIPISGVRKSISYTLRLNDAQKLKLFAFPESCLVAGYEKLKHMSIRSVEKGYCMLLKEAVQWCNKNNMRPDFNRYKQLCNHYGVAEEKERHSYKAKKSAPMYKRYKPEETVLSLRELLKERENWIRIIAQHKETPHPFIDMVKIGARQLKSIEKEMAERINQGESVV